MNMRLLRAFSFLVFTPLTVANIRAGDDRTSPLTPSEVAQAFGYSGTLEFVDITEQNRRENSRVIWSRTYRAQDNTFVPVTITVAEGRAILTPQRLEQLTAASKEHTGPNGTDSPSVHPVKLSEAEGFVFLAGLGPGGSGYSGLLTSADGKFDLVAALNFSSEVPVQKSDLTESYYDRFVGGVEENLFAVFESALGNLHSAARDRLATEQTSVESPSTFSPTPESNRSPASSPLPERIRETSGKSALPRRHYSAFEQVLVYGLGLALLAGVAVFYAKRRRQPTKSIKQ